MNTLSLFVTSSLAGVVLLTLAWSNYSGPNQPSVHSCVGDCYEAYVSANGNILEQQLAAAEASVNASPAELGQTAYASCVACHGAGAQGGIGPTLAGRDSAYTINALTAYKNRETRGAQSALMWPSASALSAADIENLASYIATL
jgi:cytochrome c553